MSTANSALNASIWTDCEELRDGMNAYQYGNFILVLLFIRIISDRAANRSLYPVIVPEGAGFSALQALKGTPDIGRQINEKILGPLAKANNLNGFPDFTQLAAWGGARLGADRLTRLIAVFENPELNPVAGADGGLDHLTALYDHLADRFARDGGDEARDHTPAEVATLVAGAAGIGGVEHGGAVTLYDPVCGSGSLLLAAAAAAGSSNDLKTLLFGQDKDVSSVCRARMNMIVHGYFTARIRWGNTLANPLFKDGTALKTFNRVVAHPPFSDPDWASHADPARDSFQRFAGFGIPPARDGDYAYLLTVLHALDESGRGVCILPHEALSRGSSEAAIRRVLVRRGLIKAVISLPRNLFQGSESAACVIVLEKGAASERGGVFMIDASRGFTKDGNGKNRLRTKDVTRIIETLTEQSDVEGYSRLVPAAEIGAADNDYDLDAARHVHDVPHAPRRAGEAVPASAAIPPPAGQAADTGAMNPAAMPAAKGDRRSVLHRVRTAARGPAPFAAAAVLLLVGVIGYVFLRSGEIAVEPVQSKTDVQIRQQIERSLSGGAAYQALKEHYPQDYGKMVEVIESNLFLGVPMSEALGRGLAAAAEVRQREAANYRMASVETLRQDLRGRLPIMRHLKAAHGARACNEFAVRGLPALQRFLGERYRKDEELVKLTDGLAARFLAAAAEGKRLKLAHKDPDGADWQAAAKHLLSIGMTEEQFGIFADPSRSIDDPGACDVFIALIDAVTAPDGGAAVKLIPFMASAAAAEQ